MLKFLKSLLGRDSDPAAKADGTKKTVGEVIEYQGYQIQPVPSHGNNGWTTEAIITREIQGELKSHHFIRADTTADKQGAIDLTVIKSKITIDQVGDRLFIKRS